MSEQWGRWFADPPAEQGPAEPVAEERAVDDVAEESAAVVGPESVEDGAVGQYEEPAVENADVARDEPELADDSDPAVSAVYALRQRLNELEELPIEEHPARYEQLHAELTAALGQIDGGA